MRRLLLDQKSFVEGGIGFLSWVSMLLDAEKRHEDPAERERAADIVALLTPVVKGFLTEEGYRLCGEAQQVFGGHGYIEETGMSQFVRDARITMIYEGATAVQALDLVGRKLSLKAGKPIMAFFDYVKGYIRDNEGDLALMRDFLDPLKAASKDLQAAAMYFMRAGMKNPEQRAGGIGRFSAPVRAGLHGVVVGATGQGGAAGDRGGGRGQAILSEQAGDRAVLHEARDARDAAQARPDRDGGRAGDGSAGRGVLRHSSRTRRDKIA